MRLALPLVALVIAFMAETPGLAQTCQGRPGASAVDEYCEAIPSADGERRPPGSTDGSNGSSSVPAATARALTRSGADGAVVIALTGSGGAATETGTQSQEPSSQPTRPSDLPRQSSDAQGAVAGVSAASERSNNPIKAVSAAIGSGATVGSGFVTLLLALTVVVLGINWTRYRKSHSS